MMKIVSTLFRIILLLVIAMIQPVDGGYFMEMIINNGKAPVVSQPCNSMDNLWLDGCFSGSGARNLIRGIATTSNVTVHEHHSDQRQAMPLFCKNLCAGYVAKTCRATKCRGYRRQLNRGSIKYHEENERRDQSANSMYCDSTIRITNKCLDMIAWTLSASCREFYNPGLRKSACRYIEKC